MPNMQAQKTKMPEQAPEIRSKNFEEVALGYTEEMARNEAERCLNCKNKPCVAGCPVGVHIPEFIEKVAEGKYEEAYSVISETSSLPAICGRVCPQENQCEKKCVRGIKGEPVAIGRLERFVADYYMNNCSVTTDKTLEKEVLGKVAVIGSGPASLSCAADLAKRGYDVTIFEAFHTPGGVLVYGIPEFRLPKALVKREIDLMKQLGVEIMTNMVIGKVLDLDEIKDMGYDAIFIGTGAGLPQFLNIPGESLGGVYSSNEFLTRINLMKGYKFPEYDTPVKLGNKVAIVGGGNVAMDAARCALRLGADEVYIVYRRGFEELPARKEEIEHAKEEGVIFKMLNNPVRIVGDDNFMVTGIECVEMELGEADESGRRRPIEVPGSNFVIDVDNVIIAIGQTPNPLIPKTSKELKVSEKGCIVADEQTGATNIPGVFSGGDAVTGAATVILAMGAGKNAAQGIDDYIRNKKGNR